MRSRRYFLNLSVKTTFFWFALIVVCLTTYYLRFIYASPYAGTWDEVDFALAVNRFDLLAMQPHFPGYPYFILGGKFISQWIENPALALSVFNVVMNLLSCTPIYLLARRKLPPVLSAVTVLLVQCLAFTWLLSTQPMSESTAIALLWWFLWSINRGLEKATIWSQIFPLLVYSLLMGVRVSYFAAGAGIVYLWIVEWQRNQKHRILRLCLLITIAMAFQLVWVSGLIMSEGSIHGFISLAWNFIRGHFYDWGGSIITSKGGMGQRLLRFTWDNIIWTGISVHSWIMVAGWGLLAAFGLYCKFSSGNGKNSSYLNEVRYNYKWIGGIVLLYGMYAFLAQNLDKPRHVAPIVVIGLFLGFIYLLQIKCSPHLKGMLAICMIVLIAFQSIIGVKLAKEQATEFTATYQLAHRLERESNSFIIYTWEESRVMDYLQVPYVHKKMLTYDYFLQEVKQRKNQHIYMTDRVLQGFKDQGADLTGEVRKVDSFYSNSLIDPVYYYIILYEWIK